jgi:hypothetical protein
MAVQRLTNLPPHVLPEVEAFFVQYAGLNGKKLRVLRHGGRRRAHKLLRAGVRAFNSKP